MNINHHPSMAESMKDMRERVERILRAQHGGTPVDVRAACQQIIERLRKLEAAYRASRADEIRVLDHIVDTAPPGPMESLRKNAPKEKPIEAPPPKRKPGRPRKVQTPAEPGGVA